MTLRWHLTPQTLMPYARIIVERQGNISKYMDTMIIFKSWSKRSKTPRRPLTTTYDTITCESTQGSLYPIPWKHIKICHTCTLTIFQNLSPTKRSVTSKGWCQPSNKNQFCWKTCSKKKTISLHLHNPGGTQYKIPHAPPIWVAKSTSWYMGHFTRCDRVWHEGENFQNTHKASLLKF